ncbi:two pore domain potassium channel family protein [Mobilitalea sibirica]|uniref:Two pore domain potassium channel family protein n=1 Tax=Mobilitalea sibirica TaxID=1462919 RepID=A0A8J7KX11_9FIRM|nr:two pore domain potassium channel family protein [Mobilitalea sibirica]
MRSILLYFINFIKKHKAIGCLMVYLAVWFFFGIVYYVLANIYQGEMFYFQNDILTKSKVVSFQKELDIKVDYDIAKALFKEDNDVTLLKMSEGDYPLLTYKLSGVGLNPIGMNWVKFYYSQWKQKKYNFFRLDLIKEHRQITGATHYNILKLTVCHIPDSTFLRSRPGQYITLPKEYMNYIKKQQTYYITLDDDFLGNFNYDRYLPLNHDLYIISNSVNLLDQEFNKAFEVIYQYQNNHDFTYPLPDFLYFSSVAISTLGYGDILPNSMLIRMLVMVETLLGTIILAVFIAFYLDYLKMKNTNHKKSPL